MRGLRYISPADTTGYAVAAKAYLRALAGAGMPLQWTPLRCPGARYQPVAADQVAEDDLRPLAHRPLDYDTVLLHTVPEYYPEWIAPERAAGRRVVGYTVWELQRLPAHWPALLNQLDAVIVPCRWNVPVLRNGGVTVPIHVVPHLSQFAAGAADAAGHAALLRRLGGPQVLQGRFVFYGIGMWTERKGMERLLRTYLDTFTSADPVALVLKTSSRDLTRWNRRWRSGWRRQHPRASLSAAALAAGYSAPASWHVIDDDHLADGEMRALHAVGDAFVSLARTEGWGLGAFDAALSGRPVVMTGHGGQTDFLPPALACLLDHRMVPAHEPLWARGYSRRDAWAEPDAAQAGRCMRALAADPAAARARGARLANHVRTEFAAERVLAALRVALERPA
ncbi:glycosyltransferase [Paracidovorax citrulli]|uniref:Glycosyltransferase n=2 Tax=Paracidovorax citrulli TaxID=80869 RepID=A1TNW2_PARC0|nr:glycosyltransferase [Paracidovorax citrulli]ABM32650.1 conserved hypothetical protein [Paracidovorax citrulli AAC00-1]ATG93345.1 hypothetical protein CQB05_04210 [Paracidovorax citrulli]PVY66867.1 hypothetical protein C8E08_4293 [Paracidovorax citrulli]QCX09227.1 hypothetical protein APS58_0259 [Paracidovorax citrulli]REG68970.1 hypothetical protein C8E07_2098 [Paracidovorax citrulli]